MSLLSRVNALLSRRGIPHALVGGLALAAHGVARSTMDADVLVVENVSNASDVWDALRREGASCDVRLGDTDDPFRAVIRVTAPGSDPVDVLVGRYAWQRDAIARARPTSSVHGNVPVVEAADLVLLKLFAGGPQDLIDIERILTPTAGTAIAARVDERVDALGPSCRQLWDELKARHGTQSA